MLAPCVIRLAHHAEGHPSVLVWDYSFDETGQHMFWVEEHMSEHTLMAYEADLREGDFGQNLSDVLDFERLIVLGPVTEPELMRFFETFPVLARFPDTLGIARQ